jgi:hypothetical protein
MLLRRQRIRSRFPAPPGCNSTLRRVVSQKTWRFDNRLIRPDATDFRHPAGSGEVVEALFDFGSKQAECFLWVHLKGD